MKSCFWASFWLNFEEFSTKMSKKCPKRPQSRPRTLKKPLKLPPRSTVFSIRRSASRMTTWRDSTRSLKDNEYTVMMAIKELREKHPRKKHFGRILVHKHLNGALSMDVLQRLLSKKKRLAFPGRDKELSECARRYNEELHAIREAGGNEAVVALSRNTCCRVSRKSNWC